MNKTITKTVYTFKDLLELHGRGEIDGRVVERARGWLVEEAIDDEWWDDDLETWKEALGQIGFTEAVLGFTGVGCGGDQAFFESGVDLDKLIAFLSDDIPANSLVAFDGEQEDFRSWIVHSIGGAKATNPKYRKLLRLEHYITATVTTQGFEANLDDFYRDRESPKVRALFDSFDRDARRLRDALSIGILRSLVECYEFETSDENLEDLSELNKFTFDEYGHRDG